MSRSYLQNLSLACLKRSILETIHVTDIAKVCRQSLAIEIYFVAQIGLKSYLRRTKLYKKNSIS